MTTIEQRYLLAKREAKVQAHEKRIEESRKMLAEIRRRSFVPGRNATAHKHAKEYGIGFYDTEIHRNRTQTIPRLNVLRTIRDINPDASLALWNYLRLSNQGHEVECFSANGKVDQRATDYINNEIAPRVGKLYGGGMDMIVNVLNLSTFTSGANALEVELSENLKEIVDFHVVDPHLLVFRRNKETDEVELCVRKDDGQKLVLNQEQVFYSPLDPDVDDPHGRSPILPTLQSVFFQVEVLADLKAVMHHQGHARFDIKMMTETMKKNMPQDIVNKGPAAIQEFIDTVCDEIEQGFEELDPDDNLIHTDDVEIDMVGGKGTGGMDISAVMTVIDRQVTASLKSLPILLGRSESTSETHATIQWEIYKAGIKSMQNATKRSIERAYNLALRVRGFMAKARVTFDELNVTDRLKEAQAEEKEIMNEILKVNQGWISNDQASIAVTGKPAYGEPIRPAAPQTGDEQSFPNQQTEAQATIRTLNKKKTEPDPYIAEMGTDWAEEVAIFATKQIKKVETRLKSELSAVLKKVDDAGMPPAEVLVEASTLKQKYIGRPFNAKPEPPDLFQFWVKTFILTDDLVQEHKERSKELMEEIIGGAANLAGVSTMLTLDVEQDFNSKDRELLTWLANRAERDNNLIRGETDKQILLTLWDVVYEGQYSIPKAKEALKAEYSFSDKRAKVIARTEIIGAAHQGQFSGDRQSGIVVAKRWAHTLDARTRPDHRMAGGQTVAFDEPFQVGGDYLMHPSDGSLGAKPKNLIQCRCYYERILQGEEWTPTP